MNKKFAITKEKLYELYIVKNYKRSDVAEYFGCSEPLIKKYIRKYNLQKPKMLENKNKERKVTKLCLNCGNDFDVVNFRKNGKWEIKFCSHSCSAKYRFLGEEHKRKVRGAAGARRRARLKNASVDLSEEEKEMITEFYVNRPDGYEVDHIVPISKGGKHIIENLQYLTVSENRRKSNKIDYE